MDVDMERAHISIPPTWRTLAIPSYLFHSCLSGLAQASSPEPKAHQPTTLPFFENTLPYREEDAPTLMVAMSLTWRLPVPFTANTGIAGHL